MIALLALIALLLTACATPERCAELYPPSAPEVRERLVTDTIHTDPYLYVFTDTVECPPALPDTVRFIRELTRLLPSKTIYVNRIERDTVTVYKAAEARKCPPIKRDKRPNVWAWLVMGLVLGAFAERALNAFVRGRITKKGG
jgi:hypothetical protein